jgi:hypothetical protein
MYTGNIIGKANVLSCDQVQELLKIRERLGGGGGVPSCCADVATNLQDVVGTPPPGVCPCKGKGCGGAERMDNVDMDRLKSEVHKRLEPYLNR